MARAAGLKRGGQLTMRARNYISADEWARRLNAEMERVLRNPAVFPPATVWWAEWRRTWLAERGDLDTPSSTTGSKCTEPVARGAEQGKLF